MQPPGPSHRGELGGGRAPSRVNSIQDFPRPPTNHLAPNPAKPPLKRVFEPDHDDELLGQARVQVGQVFQQYDAKRRRTNDEEVHEAPIRPTMEPPIRQSNIHKVRECCKVKRSRLTKRRMRRNPHSSLITTPTHRHLRILTTQHNRC